MSEEFLTPKQLKALEWVITQARRLPGVHRAPTPDGEAFAYRFQNEINWGVNADEFNIARGTCPKERKATS